VATNSAEWANHTNVDTILTELSDVRTTVDANSAEWANHTNVDTILTELSDVRTTVDANSAEWAVDTDTNKLSDLLDVQINPGAVFNNAMLKFNTINNMWYMAPDISKISDLLDVDVTTIENNDVLKYDSSNNTWYAARDLHGEGQHVDRFVELHDTPVSYDSGNPGDYVTIDTSGIDLTFTSLSDDIEFNRLTDDFTDIETTVQDNSGNWSLAHSWGDHAQAGYITNYNEADPVFNAHVASNITQTNITNWDAAHGWGDHGAAGYLTSYTETDPVFESHIASSITSSMTSNWNAAHSWGDHGAAGYLTSYTETDPVFESHIASSITDVMTGNWNAAHSWGDHGAAGYLTSYTETDPVFESHLASSITDVMTGNWNAAHSVVSTNSAEWSSHTNITDITNTLASNSANWAVLDSDGKLLENQIPELSITQTYTVQNTEEVATLNPAEGIQRGDIVIVYNSYDNLVAKQDNPSGVYDAPTKSYSGYSKLARPDAYVTAVNDKYGNVVLTSDDIDDTDNTNKWVEQTDIDRWNSSLNTTGGTMTGDLDTTARILSGGSDLGDIYLKRTDNLLAIDSFDLTGTITASAYATKNTAGDSVVGITKNVNIGGNILHIVNGIIVGVTDA
jgi:hypothetical protein